MTAAGVVLSTAAVVLAAFPTLSTPPLAMFIEIKSAVAVLIVLNLVMDGYQAVRQPGLGATTPRPEHVNRAVPAVGAWLVGRALL